MKMLEDLILAVTMRARVEGPLRLDRELFRLFLSLPEDPLPTFQGPAGLRGRGKDHPRYGRWMHAFIRYYRPLLVVEIGTNAGGTAVGIARGLVENGAGRLLCIDNGEGVPRVFPDTTRINLRATGLADDRFELICDNSANALRRLLPRLAGKAGVSLVDAAHTYDEALADIEGAIALTTPGGYILVHDIAPDLRLGTEASPRHPAPVREAFMKVVADRNAAWATLTFIRKHLGIMRV